MVNCLVIGYGSIGSRHVRLLRGLGHKVTVVSERRIDFAPAERTLAAALTEPAPDGSAPSSSAPSSSAPSSSAPGYVVIANETARHEATLRELADCAFKGTVLVEKPLFHDSRPLPDHDFDAVFVGYNLRFLEVLQVLRRRLAEEKILSVQATVGQYLPDWRPGTDYRRSASASAQRGGGALRDLSHELDLLNWLFGPWQRLAALGGRFSPLEIDSDDQWALLLSLERCPLATLHLNYLDRAGRRQLVVNTENHTYSADLLAGSLTCDDRTEFFATERDATYIAQHRAALAGDSTTLCRSEEGLAVVEMITAAERAVQKGCWVEA